MMKKVFLTPLMLVFLLALNHRISAQDAAPIQTPSKAPATTPQQDPADGGPSLKETMDWLKEKLAMNFGFDFQENTVLGSSGMSMTTYHQYKFELIKVEGCSMEWKTTDRETSDDTVTTNVNLYKVPLGDLEPFSVKVIAYNELFSSQGRLRNNTALLPNVYRVKLSPASGKTSLTGEFSTTEEEKQAPSKKKNKNVAVAPTATLHPATQQPFVTIEFKDREMAKRVAKAFEHAIQQCGGKADPF